MDFLENLYFLFWITHKLCMSIRVSWKPCNYFPRITKATCGWVESMRRLFCGSCMHYACRWGLWWWLLASWLYTNTQVLVIAADWHGMFGCCSNPLLQSAEVARSSICHSYITKSVVPFRTYDHAMNIHHNLAGFLLYRCMRTGDQWCTQIARHTGRRSARKVAIVRACIHCGI